MIYIGVFVLVTVLAIVLAVNAYAKLRVKVSPNLVAVITGGRDPNKRFVTGDAFFNNPITLDVKYMDLSPLSIEAEAPNAPAVNGVPITVKALGVLKFSSELTDLGNSTQRFLAMETDQIKEQFREMLSSSLRNIISKMSVEELISDREAFKLAVLDELEPVLRAIGVKIDYFNITTITDSNQYLNALGARQIAIVKSEAEISAADAKREERVKLAEAKRIGDLAELEAKTETALAQETHDTEMAAIQSRIQAAQATAAQAGPIAEARARQDLVAAEAAVLARDAEAQLGVEQMRAQLEQARRQTDIVALAEAQAAAAAVTAQAEADASVVTAEGAARARQLAAAAEADAAIEAARGATEGRKQVAQAALIEQRTTAEGNLALAMAEAEGKEALAAALAKFGEAATRLDILPRLIAALPEIIAAAAAPLGNIDNLTVVDSGSGSGSSALERVVGNSPITIDRALKLAAGLGLDIPRLLQGLTQSSDAPAVNTAPVVDATDSSPELVNSNHA